MKTFFVLIATIFLWVNSNTPVIAQEILAINGVSVSVSDMNKALKFYTQVLPFQIDTLFTVKGQNIGKLYGIADSCLTINIAKLHLENEKIELLKFNSKLLASRPIPADSRSNDLWFQHIAIVVSDMEKAYKLLKDNEVAHVSTAPQTLPDYIPAAAGISAFYFRDPDGHNLELIHFPKGKGNPKWQNTHDKLFLGIDHTAIGITNTKASRKFYEEFLGLKFGGESENYGTEQEHLNQVFGARLQITGLKAPNGIGLEFLDYIAPPGGRIYPTDTKPTDIWYWHTRIQVKDIEKLVEKLTQNNDTILSGIIQNSDLSNKIIQQSFLARDPDGHFLLFEENKLNTQN